MNLLLVIIGHAIVAVLSVRPPIARRQWYEAGVCAALTALSLGLAAAMALGADLPNPNRWWVLWLREIGRALGLVPE